MRNPFRFLQNRSAKRAATANRTRVLGFEPLESRKLLSIVHLNVTNFRDRLNDMVTVAFFGGADYFAGKQRKTKGKQRCQEPFIDRRTAI